MVPPGWVCSARKANGTWYIGWSLMTCVNTNKIRSQLFWVRSKQRIIRTTYIRFSLCLVDLSPRRIDNAITERFGLFIRWASHSLVQRMQFDGNERCEMIGDADCGVEIHGFLSRLEATLADCSHVLISHPRNCNHDTLQVFETTNTCSFYTSVTPISQRDG
jgi:hypothetical protein